MSLFYFYLIYIRFRNIATVNEYRNIFIILIDKLMNKFFFLTKAKIKIVFNKNFLVFFF